MKVFLDLLGPRGDGDQLLEGEHDWLVLAVHGDEREGRVRQGLGRFGADIRRVELLA